MFSNIFVGLTAFGLLFNPVAVGLSSVINPKTENTVVEEELIEIPSNEELEAIYLEEEAYALAELEKQAFLEQELGPYIVENDGYYELQIPDDIELNISFEEVELVIQGLNIAKDGFETGEFIIIEDELLINDYDEQYVISGGRNGFELQSYTFWGITVVTGVTMLVNDFGSTILGAIIILAGSLNVQRLVNSTKDYFKLTAQQLANFTKWASNTLMPLTLALEIGYQAVVVATGSATLGIGAVLAATIKLAVKLVISIFAVYAVSQYIGHGYPIIPGIIGSGRGTKTSINLLGKFSVSAQ